MTSAFAAHDDATTRRAEVRRMTSPLGPEVEDLVTRVMNCAFAVHRALGPGFRETIYEQALCLEMHSQGLRFEREKAIEVRDKEWRIPGKRSGLAR